MPLRLKNKVIITMVLRFLSLVVALCFSIYSFAQTNISKIAFGSCGSQDSPLPIFDVVVKHKPDLFIFLGDNLYGDTKNMKDLQEDYATLSAKPTFQNLKRNVPIIAIWDDHDYGKND